MRLDRVLDGAPEGTRIRRNEWDGLTATFQDDELYNDIDGDCYWLLSDILATDWEHVPAAQEIAALERAMLDAAQGAI